VHRENSLWTFSQCISAGSRSISLSVITLSKNKEGGRNGKAEQRDTYLRGKVQKCLSAEGWKQAVLKQAIKNFCQVLYRQGDNIFAQRVGFCTSPAVTFLSCLSFKR